MGKPNRVIIAPRRQRRRRRRMAHFFALGLFLALASATLAAEAPAAEKVTIVGASDSPLTVKFVHREQMGWEGRLNLVVENDSGRRGRLRMRFFPEGASQAPFVAIGQRFAGEGVLVRRIFPTTSRAPVLRRGRTRVSLAYLVTEDTPLRNASGILVVELVPAAKAVMPFFRAAPFASTFVQTKATPAGRATFVPTPIKMTVVRYFPFREKAGTSLQVALHGEGLSELASGSSGTVASTRLYSDAGETIRATIRDLNATGDDRAEATLDLDRIDRSGAYKGKFPLLAGAQDAQLDVAVDVQHSFWSAVLTVFIGAALGWFVTHAAGILRQKDLMRAALIARIQTYEKEAAERLSGKPASFDLEALLGEPPRYGRGAHCEPFPSADTARELLCRIATARSEDDLKEDQKAVTRFIDAIENWLAVEPAARELKASTKLPLDERGQNRFSGTLVARQADVLLAEAEDEPENRKAATTLARRLHLQALVWVQAAELWTLEAELEKPGSGLTKEQRKKLAADDVDAVVRQVEPSKPPLDTDYLRRLRIALWQAIGRVKDLRPGPAEEEAEEEPEPEIPLVMRPFHNTAALEYSVQAGVPTITQVEQVRGGAVLLWLAERALSILGWLRRIRALPRKVWAGMRARAASRRGDPYSPRRIRDRWTRRDFALTAIAASVSAAAYTATLYDSTWGTFDDYLAAFAAGFLGKVVVDWGDQFVSKSLRFLPIPE